MVPGPLRGADDADFRAGDVFFAGAVEAPAVCWGASAGSVVVLASAGPAAFSADVEAVGIATASMTAGGVSMDVGTASESGTGFLGVVGFLVAAGFFAGPPVAGRFAVDAARAGFVGAGVVESPSGAGAFGAELFGVVVRAGRDVVGAAAFAPPAFEAAGFRAAGLRAAGRAAGVPVASVELGADRGLAGDFAPVVPDFGVEPLVFGDLVVADFVEGAEASDDCPTGDASCIFWSGASWGESSSGVTGTTYQVATVYSRPRPTSASFEPVNTPSAVLRYDNNRAATTAPSRGVALTWAMA